MRAPLPVLALLIPCVAAAEVGKVTELSGAATRMPAGGGAIALGKDAAIELGDTIEVTSGQLVIQLSDASLLALDQGTRLRIDEADFGDLETERRSFSARLLLGSLWTKVAKLAVGTPTKFEITTERAVAGVRGTEFTVEYAPDRDEGLVVGVDEGAVDVEDTSIAATQSGPRKRERLQAGRAWVVTKKGVLRRRHAMRAGAFRDFVVQRRLAWRKRMVEQRRELVQTRVKLLKQRATLERQKKALGDGKGDAVKERQRLQETREKLKQTRGDLEDQKQDLEQTRERLEKLRR